LFLFVVGFILLASRLSLSALYLHAYWHKGLPALVIALPVELILFFVITYLTKPTSDQTIAKFFDQLEKYVNETPDPKVESF